MGPVPVGPRGPCYGRVCSVFRSVSRGTTQHGAMNATTDRVKQAIRRLWVADLDRLRDETLAFLAACEARLARVERQNAHTPQLPLLGTVALQGRAPIRSFPQWTLKRAVLDILKSAEGHPMHVLDDIYPRLAAYDVAPKGKPIEVIDSTIINALKQNAPVERVGPRVWRWVEGAPEAPDATDDVSGPAPISVGQPSG